LVAPNLRLRSSLLFSGGLNKSISPSHTQQLAVHVVHFFLLDFTPEGASYALRFKLLSILVAFGVRSDQGRGVEAPRR
jgi:hypothetical protein